MENALFVGLQDGSVVRCHLTSLAFDCMLGCGVEHSDAVNALEADDQYLYSGGEDAVVLVWDLKEANAVREISMPEAPIRSLLRVDVALWVGEADGSVEIFDIFGDDSNGIERVCRKAPHAGGVTDLFKVGETEVWSLCAAPIQADVPPESGASVACWDTKELTFEMSPDIQERDLTSVTVVGRAPFEEVTLVALTNTLGPQLVSRQVRGVVKAAGSEAASQGYDDVLSDLESRLVDASQDQEAMRGSPQFRRASAHGDTDIAPGISVSIVDGLPLRGYPFEEDVGEQGPFSPLRANGAPYQGSPLLSGPEGNGLTLSRSVSETLVTSLQRVSELLVSLLTDDVLSPSEGHTRGSNDELRSNVAAITQELNIGRQLIESCTAASNSDNSVITVDENELTRNIRNISPSCYDPSIHQLRKRLDREIESKRLLEKDLVVVTKERDLFAEELEQIKTQSDNAMSQLEGIIRDKDASTVSKDEAISELREECGKLETMYLHEMAHREKVEKERGEEMENHTRQAELSKKTFEEKLKAAYDKIETKSIQIQSQRDSLRACEAHVEQLKTTNSLIESKFKSSEEKVIELLDQLRNLRSEWDAKSSTSHSDHTKQLEMLTEEYESKIRSAETEFDGKVSKLNHRCEELTEQKSSQDAIVHSLNKELESLRAESQAAKRRELDLQSEHEAALNQARDWRRNELEVARNDIQVLQSKIEAVKADTMEQLAASEERRQKEILDRETTIGKFKSSVMDLQVKLDAGKENLKRTEATLKHLKDEHASLTEEIEHRRAAADLYEKEAAELRLALSSYKGAAEDLQAELGCAEQDTADLRFQLDELRRAAMPRLSENLEPNQRENVRTDEKANVEDNKNAVEALLASANGEIEQMSVQLEAMHTANREQEKELAALRYALSSGCKSPSDGNQRSIVNSSSEDSIRKDGHMENRDHEEGSDVSTGTPPDSLVNTALRELQEGMVMTQDKLRLLSKMARKYRESAQSHIEILPALRELECELARVCQEDPRKTDKLSTARGVVQSVIAQYYSTSEKQAALEAYDETAYMPSSRRLEALQTVLSQMRAKRIGSADGVRTPVGRAFASADIDRRTIQRRGAVEDIPTPRRLLTF